MSSSDKHIDAQLVKDYQSGNTTALTHLVKRWHLNFCRKANSILKDPDLSKDVAQECWKIIMVKIMDLKEPDKFGGWAMRIVYSKSLDTIRSHSRERKRKETYALEYNLEPEAQEDENLLLKRELLKGIKELPYQQQHVIKLFYVEDYSLREISEILNISIGTAKSRLFHAREKLKQHLKHRNYEN